MPSPVDHMESPPRNRSDAARAARLARTRGVVVEKTQRHVQHLRVGAQGRQWAASHRRTRRSTGSSPSARLASAGRAVCLPAVARVAMRPYLEVGLVVDPGLADEPMGPVAVEPLPLGAFVVPFAPEVDFDFDFFALVLPDVVVLASLEPIL